MATVFGAISANTKTTRVSKKGANIATSSLPNLSATIVVILDARIFDRVFPIKIAESILSGFCRRDTSKRAFLFFLFALC